MPSYAQAVKNELARKFDEEPECLHAELAALFKIGAIAIEGRMEFSSGNAAVARKVITLVKKIFPQARKEIAAVRTRKLRKSMRYVVRIFLTGHAEEFFREMNSLDVARKSKAKVAYLRGAFLAGGTINRPESQYYMEITTPSEVAAGFVNKLFVQLEFKPVLHPRRENFVVYISEADSIEDFLGMLGAEAAVERFEIARNVKEVRANANRITNCEVANLNKAIDAAQRQLADIRVLLEHNIKVNEDLRQTMEMRLKYPDSTVGELADKIYITRPGLMYRFKLIHKLAQEILQK